MAPDTGSEADQVRAVAAALAAAPKYTTLCPAALERVARWSVPRSRSVPEAVKRAKSKLHQVTGAFLDKAGFKRLSRLTDPLPSEEEGLAAACGPILDLHASTRERAPLLDELYPSLFRRTGVPHTVLDLACGLHPFGLPRMDLPRTATYLAYDLDERVTHAVALLLRAWGQAGRAACADLLTAVPDAPADLVFLLKTATSLEAQEPGALVRVLSRLQAPWAVVSFPLQSLGGRRKGMETTYPAFMRGVLEEGGWPAEELVSETEAFYLVNLEGKS